MKTPDEILMGFGIEKQGFDPKLYDNIRKAMDEFADQYYQWKIDRGINPVICFNRQCDAHTFHNTCRFNYTDCDSQILEEY